MPYHHLTSMERGQIQAWLTQGLSQRAIAVQLGRSASTVCRELTRNRAPSKAYCAARAQKRLRAGSQGVSKNHLAQRTGVTALSLRQDDARLVA